MTKRPIRNRLILVGIMVISAITGATGLIVQMQRQSSIDAFATATTNLCNGMAQQTTQSFASVDHALADVQADLTSTADATPEGGIEATARLERFFEFMVDQRKRLPSVDALMFVDRDGMVTSATTGWPAATADLSMSDVFRHFSTVNDRAVFVGAPMKDPVSNEWTTFMARRVNGAVGRFAGIVVAQVSLTALEKFYQLAMPPAPRSVYLVRHDGVVLVRYPPREEEIGETIPDESSWYATVTRGGGTYHSSAFFDSTQIIAAVQPLRNLPLVVQAAVTETDALAEWYQQRLWVALGAVTAALSVIVLLRLFAAQYRRIELSESSLETKITELGIAHEQLDATLANLSQGVCFYDEDSRLVVCNRAYRDVYRLADDAIRPGMTLAEVAELRIAAGSFTARTVSEYAAGVAETVKTGRPDARISKLTDGRTVSAHLQPLAGRGWVVTIEDITVRCEAEAKVAFLARHDVLTGLPNRGLFQERLEQALTMAQRGKGFALLCLDLDGFKAVNDTFGHAIGDSLLRAVTGRLQAVMRDGDTVARLGGDEFAILQLGVSAVEDVTVVARRLVHSISESFTLDGHQVSVGTSIGIALAPGDSMLPAQLMKAADLALYRAKDEGRGTWRFFEISMDSVARTRRALEADLKNAMPMGQLELYYQPLVWSGDRSLTGFEALLRWHHPTRGVVGPDDFISVAEETGLIDEMGSWVLQRACAEAINWPDGLRVSVNLSTRQFRGQDLVRVVADALRVSGLSADRLELEITESVPLQKSQVTLATLHGLRGLGARVALDDFGTGYSSLSYLRGFPFDTIKIDRSFVADLQSRDSSIPLIRGIIGLATKLRMNVTAEGVETEGQFHILAEAGCTEMQGFLISQPVPAGELPDLIERLSGRRGSAMPRKARVPLALVLDPAVANR